MTINLGSTAIADAKLGATQVDKIYLGATEVWSKTAPAIKALKFTSTGSQTLGINTSKLGTMTPNFEYSTDGGDTWTTWSDLTAPLSFGSGTNLYLRGSNTVLAISGSYYINFVFSTASPVECTGNIMHLFDYTQDLTAFPDSTSHGTRSMFAGCTALTTAPALPVTTLLPNCYKAMFDGCSSLLQCPELPATSLAESCYAQMFRNCSAITTAPELPATIIASKCYQTMFRGCTNLTTPSALPATSLGAQCYSEMFRDCTALNAIPALPATTLAANCYQYMFHSCTNIKMSATQTGEYQNTYTFGAVPSNTYANTMFANTGGTFTGTPTTQTYYTSNTIIN